MSPLKPSTEIGIHTISAEVKSGNQPSFYIDFGSGIVEAGNLALSAGKREFHIFMTHLHTDHICGAPSFAPFYKKGCKLYIYSTRDDTEQTFRTIFSSPLHPITYENLSADIEYFRLPEIGERNFPELGVTLFWNQLNHPQDCTCYRIQHAENAFIFATDVQLADCDQKPIELLFTKPYNAALAFMDGFFDKSEIHKYADWGHSSWQRAAEFAEQFHIKQCAIIHHHPARTDKELLAWEKQAGTTVWGRDGQQWQLRGNHAYRL